MSKVGYKFIPVPIAFIDQQISQAANAVWQYVYRHQKAFGNTEVRLSNNEFTHGRFKAGKKRMDHGCGLTSKNTVKAGVKELQAAGWLTVREDFRDKARMRFWYAITTPTLSKNDTVANSDTVAKNDSQRSNSDRRGSKNDGRTHSKKSSKKEDIREEEETTLPSNLSNQATDEDKQATGRDASAGASIASGSPEKISNAADSQGCEVWTSEMVAKRIMGDKYKSQWHDRDAAKVLEWILGNAEKHEHDPAGEFEFIGNVLDYWMDWYRTDRGKINGADGEPPQRVDQFFETHNNVPSWWFKFQHSPEIAARIAHQNLVVHIDNKLADAREEGKNFIGIFNGRDRQGYQLPHKKVYFQETPDGIVWVDFNPYTGTPSTT